MPRKGQKKVSAKQTPEAAHTRRRVTRGSSANAAAQLKTPRNTKGIALTFQSPDGHVLADNKDENEDDFEVKNAEEADTANVANVLLTMAGERHSSHSLQEKKDDNHRSLTQPHQEGGDGGNINSDDSVVDEETGSDGECLTVKEGWNYCYTSAFASRSCASATANNSDGRKSSSPPLNLPEDDNSSEGAENDTGDRKRKRESKRIAEQKERKETDTNKPSVTATEVGYKIHGWFNYHKRVSLKGILLLKRAFYIVFIEDPNKDGYGIAKLGFVYAVGNHPEREHCFGRRLKNILQLCPNGKVHVKCIDLEGASFEATTTIEELAKYIFYAQTRTLPGVRQSIYRGVGECHDHVTMSACDVLVNRMLEFAQTGAVHYKVGNRNYSIKGTSFKKDAFYKHFRCKTNRTNHSRTNGCIWGSLLDIDEVDDWSAEWEAFSLHHEATCPCLQHIPGIENLDETCYLSAALQMLFCIPDFQNELQRFHINSDKTPLTDALLPVSNVIGNQLVNPSEVKEVLNEITLGSMETGQQDAHECLVTLLSQLREEWNGSDDYSVLVVEVRRQCKSCGHKRSEPEPETHHHLCLDLGDEEEDSLSVKQCIKDYFDVREVECACSCGCNVFTEERNIIARPKVLIVQFNRYLYDEEDGDRVYEKIHSDIHIDESLSLYNFYPDNSNEDPPNLDYVLSGIVFHIGDTPFCGHYTSCIKTEDHVGSPCFVHYDDERGERRASNYITSLEAKRRQCYMAMYVLDETN